MIISKPIVGLNSILIGKRNIEEIYDASNKIKTNLELYIDLRSKRNPKTDISGIWKVAHDNSDFDISEKDSLQKAIFLSKKYKRQIIAISLYCGACYNQDREYGISSIKNASKLLEISTDRGLILRLVGGNARTEDEKNYAIETIAQWIKTSKEIYSRDSAKIIIGLELHQGQWPQTIKEALEIKSILKRKISNEEYQLFGFIDDPTNRYITLKNLEEFYRQNDKLNKLIENIVYYHIKNVKRIGKDCSKDCSFQKAGDKFFNFDGYSFQWAEIVREGDLELETIISNFLFNCKRKIIGFSTEYIQSTKNQAEVIKVVNDYTSLIEKVYTKLTDGKNEI